MGPSFRRLILATAALLAVCSFASAAIIEPVSHNAVVKLTKGSSTVTRDPRTVTPQNPQGDLLNLTAENCESIRDAIIAFDGLTRESGSNVYKCVIEKQAIVRFKANTSCAPPRAPETRQTACPGDSTRTFTQTRRWTVAPAPTCEIAGAWDPLTPSATECPPPALAAPTGVAAANTATSCASGQCTIRLNWNVVADALSYQVRRCIGASCDPVSQPALGCTTARQFDHVTLGNAVTVRYQVAASRREDCSDGIGSLSSVVSATTPSAAPAGPPNACTGLVCRISWTPTEPPRSEGFRVVYGRSPDQLTQTVQVVPGTVTSTEVTMPANGVWYFGVLSFLDGNQSTLSDVVARTVR